MCCRICTRQLKFTDFLGNLSSIYELDQSKIDEQYFQPQMILGGQNKFALNIKSFEEDEIEKLLSLKHDNLSNLNYIENSIVFNASGNN